MGSSALTLFLSKFIQGFVGMEKTKVLHHVDMNNDARAMQFRFQNSMIYIIMNKSHMLIPYYGTKMSRQEMGATLKVKVVSGQYILGFQPKSKTYFLIP